MKRTLIALMAILAAGDLWAAEPRTVVGSNLMDLTVLRDEVPEFLMETRIMGPRWSTKPMLAWERHALPTVEGGKTRVYDNPKTAIYDHWYDFPKKPLHPFGIRQEVTAEGRSGVRLRYMITPGEELSLGSLKDAKSLTVGLVIAHTPPFDGGKFVVTVADGKTHEMPLPVGMHGFPGVKDVALTTGAGETIRLAFDPPLFLHCDNAEMRFFVGDGQPVAVGKTFTQEIAVTFPGPVEFEPVNRIRDKSSWFPLDTARVCGRTCSRFSIRRTGSSSMRGISTCSTTGSRG